MIFVLRRTLFANKRSHIQEIADCHNFLLWSRVHRSLHTRQNLVMKTMKIWDLIWCIWVLYLGISKLPLIWNQKTWLSKLWVLLELPVSLPKPGSGDTALNAAQAKAQTYSSCVQQKFLNSSFAGRRSVKNLWPLHEIFRCISWLLKWNYSSYQKLSLETGMRQLENRMISLSYPISCQHLWGTGHALAM